MLPVGSVVYLAEGTQKMLIMNRGAVTEQKGEQVVFDYTGSIYPIGLNPEQVYYFNEEDIDEVVFEGYKDEEEERFIEVYEKWKEKHKDQITKGKVQEDGLDKNLNVDEEETYGF